MADAIKFKVGDVVVAKSGGPKMTIEFFDYGIIVALWFDKDRLRNGRFAPEALEYATIGDE